MKNVDVRKDKRLFVIDHNQEATCGALFVGEKLVQYFLETSTNRSLVGNIYCGKVRKIAAKMQAVFIDIGLKEMALLSVRDIVNHGSKNVQDLLATFFEGQKVWVQVSKDAPQTGKKLSRKGVRVTTELSLETEYLVFFPNNSQLSVSKKIADSKCRQALINDIKERVAEHAVIGGFIIRSLVREVQGDSWLEDVNILWQQWQTVKSFQQQTTKVGMVYQAPSLIDQLSMLSKQESIRILQGIESAATHFGNVEVDFQIATEQELQNELQGLGLDNQLDIALSTVVEIPQGGSIVFDNTEALTVVDVNMSSAIKANLSAFDVNMNAAKLICEQLLLRNIGGMIIIDFIRMHRANERKKILELMQQLMEEDCVKAHVFGFTRLGLFELSRERINLSLHELLTKNND